MINLFNSLLVRHRDLIVDKEDVMIVLDELDKIHQSAKFAVLMSMEIGCCGWANEPTKWYIMLKCSDKHWRTLIGGLEKMNRKIILKKDDRYHLEKG